jgi:predicted DsbA family dithiol-disulfide isomerase
MPVHVDVYSDYVCPYCMLAEPVIAQATAGKDVVVRWRPFELRPEPNPTLRPEDEYLPRVWAKSVYPMADRLGVPIVLPKVSPQPYTHTAFEGFRYAEQHGRGDEYNAAIFKAFFRAERDIGDVDVLVDIAEQVALDGVEFRQALTDRRYQADHQDALRHAVDEARVHVVPTIVVDGDRRIEGVPDLDELSDAVDAAVAAQDTSR